MKNVSEILTSIRIISGDAAINIENLEQFRLMQYYPGIRAHIYLFEYLEKPNFGVIDIEIRNDNNYSTTVQLDGFTTDTNRPLYWNKLRQTGSLIKLEKNEKN